MNKMERLVIDTETTGLSPLTNQVLSIGLLHIESNLNSLKILNEKHILVKHDEYNISKRAMQVNKINLKEHEKKAYTTKDTCKVINSFIKKENLSSTKVLGHNVNFDINFLNNLFENEQVEYPFFYEKEDTRYLWDDLKKRKIINPLLNSKLSTIANHFNIDCSKAHCAIDDCKITAKVYQRIIQLKRLI
jgi:DNA polymerase III epsilon subunit-like protein